MADNLWYTTVHHGGKLAVASRMASPHSGNKERDFVANSLVPFIQSGDPVHGILLPIFSVDLPYSVIPLWRDLHGYFPEACLFMIFKFS